MVPYLSASLFPTVEVPGFTKSWKPCSVEQMYKKTSIYRFELSKRSLLPIVEMIEKSSNRIASLQSILVGPCAAADILRKSSPRKPPKTGGKLPVRVAAQPSRQLRFGRSQWKLINRDRRRLQQGRPESASCDNCYGPYQLLVAAQPELNHRARYLTEGSRGAVKDRSQTGYPAVQLLGWSQPVELCVFAGSDTGRPRPHGYYQVCRVAGRHGCCEAREVVQDGTRMLLIPLQPRDGAVISLDCIGILKLRNADVDYHHQQQQPLYEQHSTKIPRSGRSSNGKRSSKVRLVFRVVLPLSDGTRVTLQTATQAIECSQPTGQPEIHRLSSHESMARGGGDLFIIGRNFGKGAQVVFREAAPRPGAAIWEASAAIETELSATNHLVCRVPAFGSCVNEDDNDIVSDNSNEEASRDQLAAGSLPVLTEPVRVLLRVVCGDKSSEPACFTYLPEFGAAELSNTPVALPGNQSHALAQQQPHADMIDYLHNPGSAHQQLQHLHHRQLDIDAAFLDCQDADVASSMVGSMAHW